MIPTDKPSQGTPRNWKQFLSVTPLLNGNEGIRAVLLAQFEHMAAQQPTASEPPARPPYIPGVRLDEAALGQEPPAPSEQGIGGAVYGWNIEQILVYIWQCHSGGSSAEEYPYERFRDSEAGKRLRLELAALQSGEQDTSGAREALGEFVSWCDRNDWGSVPKALQSKWRAAIQSGDTAWHHSHCFRSYGPNDATCELPYGHEGECGPKRPARMRSKFSGELSPTDLAALDATIRDLKDIPLFRLRGAALQSRAGESRGLREWLDEISKWQTEESIKNSKAGKRTHEKVRSYAMVVAYGNVLRFLKSALSQTEDGVTGAQQTTELAGLDTQRVTLQGEGIPETGQTEDHKP